jgi:ketosteroid isomerase-like protein
MPEENVEIVRRGLDALLEAYEQGMATDDLLEMCAPDIRVDATRRVFNPEVYEGHAGVQRSVRDTCEAWDDFRYENERFIEVGERVLVIQTIGGRGHASNAEVHLKGAMVWTLGDGLVTHIEVFIDPQTALESLGLNDGD